MDGRRQPGGVGLVQDLDDILKFPEGLRRRAVGRLAVQQATDIGTSSPVVETWLLMPQRLGEDGSSILGTIIHDVLRL
jgi:hypothetical protein